MKFKKPTVIASTLLFVFTLSMFSPLALAVTTEETTATTEDKTSLQDRQTEREAKKQEALEAAKEKAEAAREAAKEKSQEARKQACTNRKDALQARIDNAGSVATKLKSRFDTILLNVQDYVDENELNIENYDQKVAVILSAQGDAQEAISLLTDLSLIIDCEDIETLSQVLRAYADAVVETRSALKTYKDALKELAQVVKEIAKANQEANQTNEETTTN